MNNVLYSLVVELAATSHSIIAKTTGHQAHALFLHLIHQIDPALAARLHDEPNYRPFTISPLYTITKQDKEEEELRLRGGQKCQLRITLLDGNDLWHGLMQHFLENPNVILHIGQASFTLLRVYSAPAIHVAGRSSTTNWHTLASTKVRTSITLHFVSPTAFSLGDRHFALFPEPGYVWDSLMRSWNRYAPEVLQVEKETMRAFVAQHISIQDYRLQTETLHFPKYRQKGFVGSCTYAIKTQDASATQATALAEFAHYCGIGYKTTMGMGQVSVEQGRDPHDSEFAARGSDVEVLS